MTSGWYSSRNSLRFTAAGIADISANPVVSPASRAASNCTHCPEPCARAQDTATSAALSSSVGQVSRTAISTSPMLTGTFSS